METPASSYDPLLESNLHSRVGRASRAIPRPLQRRLFILALILSDFLMIGLGFRLAYWVRFELSLPVFVQIYEPSMVYYSRLVMILLPLWLIIFAIAGLYDHNNLLGGTQEYASVFKATTVGMLAVIAASFLETNFVIARGWLIVAALLNFLLVSSGRFILRRVVYSLRQRGYFLSTALIVGANQEGKSLAEQLMTWRTSGLNLLGFVDDKLPAGASVTSGLHALGTVKDLERLVQQYQVEELILAASAISSRHKMLEIFKRYGVSNGVNVRISSGLYEIITTGLSVKEFAYVPLVGINKVRLTGIDRFLKFLLDYGLTLPGLLVLSPVLLAIAVLVKLDSPGPVIHRRRVMGVNGKTFDAFKFRTMHTNGDEILEQYPALKKQLAVEHKLKWDPRVTGVGEFLRKSSLDELPQLFNVLRREMSLVGPRMITPAEIEKYDHWDINLLTVRPGITGLWQVSGRSDIRYDQRVELDMHYIRNWSIWLDLQLLLQTIPAVLRRRGAY